MSAIEIKVGRVYRAKKPTGIGFYRYYNDRQVLWISPHGDLVQFDSPTVRDGRNYPKVPMEKFLKWAGSDVTGTLPDGNWAEMPWRTSRAKATP